MVALSVLALCVFIFSAYAYGATVLLALRAVPVWASHGGAPRADRARLDPVSLTMCIFCTMWFVGHAFAEFRVLTGGGRWEGWTDLLMLVMSYGFPPLIMHTVLKETYAECSKPPASVWWSLLLAMYALCFAVGLFMALAGYNVIPRPRPFGAYSGISVGLLFVMCSLYCMALILRRPPKKTPERPGLRRSMIGLFLLMIVVFFSFIVLQGDQLFLEALDRLSRTIPIFFLITSVYFENRFEFYDLIVKRAAMLVISLLAAGGYLAVTLGALEQLPSGAARPWLFALALLPLVTTLPWLHARVGRWLDRMWFGREFTPVEAVKQVLSAMQPATDEAALVAATEARLSEMFRTPVHILLEDQEPPQGATIEAVIGSASPATGAPLRVAVEQRAESRPLLSEDLTLLRSLASVFGFMLENVRLQRRRQEQDQIAQELRLQTSRSELKALRAQINPHFLFNALNAIASLIHTDPARADAAVEQLAEVFRYTLRRSEQEWAPLDQELAFAQAYLDVEQARFGRRLTCSIASEPSIAATQVPAMLLQTLVENAVKHGISQVRGAGRIDIRARAEGGELILEVRDTGPGPQPTSGRGAGGEHFGLRSVRDRLHGHFGERARLELAREDTTGMTVARIRMPLIREDAVVGSRR